MPKTRPPYPAEFEQEAVRLLRAKAPTPKQLAVKLGRSEQTLNNWLRQDQLDRGERQDGLTSEERAELRVGGLSRAASSPGSRPPVDRRRRRHRPSDSRRSGHYADAVIIYLDHREVRASYQLDRAAARTAASSPTEPQGKATMTDGPSATPRPRSSLGGTVAGSRPAASLRHFSGGLTTKEVAQLLARGNDLPDRPAVERSLFDLAAAAA